MYNIHRHENNNWISSRVSHNAYILVKGIIETFINDVKSTIGDDVKNKLPESFTTPNLISYDVSVDIDNTVVNNYHIFNNNFRLTVMLETQSIKHVMGFPIHVTPVVEWDKSVVDNDHMKFNIQFMYKMEREILFSHSSQGILFNSLPLPEIKPCFNIPEEIVKRIEDRNINISSSKKTNADNYDLYQHSVGDTVLKTKAIEFIREVTLAIYMDENLRKTKIIFNFDLSYCVEKAERLYYEYIQSSDPHIKRLRDEKGINIINILEYLFEKPFIEIIIEQIGALYWYNIKSILEYYKRCSVFSEHIFNKSFAGKADLDYNSNEKFPTKIIWESNGCELTQKIIGDTKK